MKKRLNLDAINTAMDEAGLSQTNIAKSLGITREAVSKWIQGIKFPRPDKLLKLAMALDLRMDDIILREDDPSEPIIAFRKRRNTKTTAKHVAHAIEIGRSLSNLVPYLPYDLLVQPATLKTPSIDYEYLQTVAQKIRSEIGLGPDDELDFVHLIKKFNDLQAVIVPVLWGKKEKHENALHIYLPDSMTTWVYLNLDVEVHDFKFWMAHELSHVYTPELSGSEEGEDFADALAGALIFPETLASKAYTAVAKARSDKSRIAKIRTVADCYSISLISVFYEINNYAKHYGLPEIKLANRNSLFGANTNFNKQFHTISQTILGQDNISTKSYIQSSSEIFETHFFEALKSYLIENRKSAGYVQSILDIPLLDAKGIHAELS